MLISRGGGCDVTLIDLVTLTLNLSISNKIADQDYYPPAMFGDDMSNGF